MDDATPRCQMLGAACRLATLEVPGARPVWVALDAAGPRHFTGELTFAFEPPLRVWFTAGRAYLAERDGDTPLTDRLLAAGLLSAEQLDRGTVTVGDRRHLGRLFARVPELDRDRIEVAVEVATAELLGAVAHLEAPDVGVAAWRLHPSGVHEWWAPNASRAIPALDDRPADPEAAAIEVVGPALVIDPDLVEDRLFEEAPGDAEETPAAVSPTSSAVAVDVQAAEAGVAPAELADAEVADAAAAADAAARSVEERRVVGTPAEIVVGPTDVVEPVVAPAPHEASGPGTGGAPGGWSPSLPSGSGQPVAVLPGVGTSTAAPSITDVIAEVAREVSGEATATPTADEVPDEVRDAVRAALAAIQAATRPPVTAGLSVAELDVTAPSPEPEAVDRGVDAAAPAAESPDAIIRRLLGDRRDG